MRRILNCLLVCVLLLSGCMKNTEKSASQTAYEGYYKAIEDVTRFQGSSLYYKLTCEMSKVAENSYRYYIFIDQPQCAMYDVVMMAVADDLPLDNSKTMMPSIGIFEDSDYNMIPFQSYVQNGYVKGLVISGETQNPEVSLKILVEWHDRTGENDYREFHSYIVNEEGFTHKADDDTVVQKSFYTVESPAPETTTPEVKQ